MSFSKPIFLRSSDCPKETSTFLICSAGERVAGPKSLVGAQHMGDVWRVHAADDKVRATLLASGLNLKGEHVSLFTDNPFIVRGPDGKEIPSTKLTIDGVPISFSNDEISKSLKVAGVVARSRILMEYARDPDGKLTNWVTGRRFLYIDLPQKVLPKLLDMGPFKARIFYREMKDTVPQCKRCFGTGHWANQCPNQEKCFVCFQEGHRRGDPQCPGADTSTGVNRVEQSQPVEKPSIISEEGQVTVDGTRPEDRSDEESVELEGSTSGSGASSEDEGKVSSRGSKKSKKRENKKKKNAPPAASAREDSSKKEESESERNEERGRVKGKGSGTVTSAGSRTLHEYLVRARSTSKRRRSTSPADDRPDTQRVRADESGGSRSKATSSK